MKHTIYKTCLTLRNVADLVTAANEQASLMCMHFYVLSRDVPFSSSVPTVQVSRCGLCLPSEEKVRVRVRVRVGVGVRVYSRHWTSRPPPTEAIG